MAKENQQQNSMLCEEILNEKIKFLKSGLNHTTIVTKENNIYVNGSNVYGQSLILLDYKVHNMFYKYNEITFENVTNLECVEDFTIIVNNYNEFYFSDRFYLSTNGMGYLSKKKYLIKIVFSEINEEIILMRSTKRILYFVTKSNKFYKIYFSTENRDLKLEKCFKIVEIKNNFYKIKDIQFNSFYSLLLDKYGN